MKLIDDLDKALGDRAEALNVKDTYAYKAGYLLTLIRIIANDDKLVDKSLYNLSPIETIECHLRGLKKLNGETVKEPLDVVEEFSS